MTLGTKKNRNEKIRAPGEKGATEKTPPRIRGTSKGANTRAFQVNLIGPVPYPTQPALSRSPDGAKRNPGTPYPRKGLPRIPLRFMRATRSALIQRLDLDDGRAEIAADPQHGPIA